MKGLSFDKDSSKVILIGNSDFDDDKLDNLPTVENNLKHLYGIFQEEDIIGLNNEEITTILDEEHPSSLAIKLSKETNNTFGTLVIYYAGHGKIGGNGELMLAVQKTDTSALDFSAFPFAHLRKIILDSPARQKILILDCCFSGRAIDYLGVSDDLVKGTEIEGTFVLTSVPRNSLAKATDEQGEFTAFTSAFIDVLEEGVKIRSKFLTIDDIYRSLKKHKAIYNLPLKSANEEISEFKFAKNRQYQARISFELKDGHIISTENATLSRMTMAVLREIELKNGIHQQRFILISSFYMNYLELDEGDWAEVEVSNNNFQDREFVAVFSKPQYYKEYSIYLPLAVRNLLNINNLSNSKDSQSLFDFEGIKMKISKADLTPRKTIKFQSDDFICRIPITEEILKNKNDLPYIAIRALEFELLQLTTFDEVNVTCTNKDGNVIYSKIMIAVILKDNPGRAVCGITKYVLDEILNIQEKFEMEIEKNTTANKG